MVYRKGELQPNMIDIRWPHQMRRSAVLNPGMNFAPNGGPSRPQPMLGLAFMHEAETIWMSASALSQNYAATA